MMLATPVEPVPLATDAYGTICVGGTRVTLDLVIGAFLDGVTSEEIVQQLPALDLADVYAAIAFYLRHRPEVDAYLREGEEQAAAARQEWEERWPKNGLRERLLARREQQQ